MISIDGIRATCERSKLTTHKKCGENVKNMVL